MHLFSHNTGNELCITDLSPLTYSKSWLSFLKDMISLQMPSISPSLLDLAHCQFGRKGREGRKERERKREGGREKGEKGRRKGREGRDSREQRKQREVRKERQTFLNFRDSSPAPVSFLSFYNKVPQNTCL